MNQKAKSKIISLINAFIIAGIIILVIGLYYYIFKAGIPYQDPTIELQIQYETDNRIGDLLMKTGFLTFICSGLIRTVFYLISKKVKKIIPEKNL